jgi:predicted NAD/FAD-dependent oxidoreductase
LRFSGFEGEDNKVCHSVRDGTKFQKETTTDTFDVVVIGSGVSGLTAAYKLRDKYSIKVIEKENRIGGAASRGNWKGIYYSRGTADTGPSYEINYNGKKINFLEPFFKELSIPWRKVADPTDAFHAENHLTIDPFHRTVSSSNKDEQAFEDAWELIEDFQKKYGNPVIPAEASSSGWTELDKKSFRDVFAKSGEYFLRFLDRYSYSTFGASAKEISAFAGLYYMSRELQDRFACPGGNACVSEALASHLSDSIELNAAAVLVEQDDHSCFVTYIDGQGSKITVKSKAVVWACQKHYAPYVIKGLPENQIQAFGKVRYDSFIVANVLSNEIFYDKAFATYFENTIFTDMIIADWMVTDGKKKVGSGEPEVYTLYCPIGEHNRGKVLSEPAENWINLILKGLKKYFPDAEKSIEDIRLFRYGHHYVLGYPGFITGPRMIAKKPFGLIFFAKDDMQGVPCLESAVWSGIDASNKLMEKLG